MICFTSQLIRAQNKDDVALRHLLVFLDQFSFGKQLRSSNKHFRIIFTTVEIRLKISTIQTIKKKKREKKERKHG